jgi:drug/metabolite transporter (DMT)-like permease
MIAAAAILWLVTLLLGQVRPTFAALRRRPEAMKYILGGAFFGPFLGVTLSLVAVQRTQVGIASTLLALPPIFLLPISHFVFKERIGWSAIAGTLVAVAGVAILALA